MENEFFMLITEKNIKETSKIGKCQEKLFNIHLKANKLNEYINIVKKISSFKKNEYKLHLF